MLDFSITGHLHHIQQRLPASVPTHYLPLHNLALLNDRESYHGLPRERKDRKKRSDLGARIGPKNYFDSFPWIFLEQKPIPLFLLYIHIHNTNINIIHTYKRGYLIKKNTVSRSRRPDKGAKKKKLMLLLYITHKNCSDECRVKNQSRYIVSLLS